MARSARLRPRTGAHHHPSLDRRPGDQLGPQRDRDRDAARAASVRLADVEFDSRGIDVIARVSGEIDLSNANDLESALIGAMSNHSRALIVDLSHVQYLDSAGIQLIYRLRESLRARRQRLAVVIPNRSPAPEALRLAGVAEHVETIETLDDAVHALE